MKKYILTALAALVLSVSFTGCGDEEPPAAEVQEQTDEDQKQIKELLKGEDPEGTESLLNLTVLHQIDQSKRQSRQIVNAYTNYDGKDVASQELMIDVEDKGKTRIIYNDGAEFTRAEHDPEWTVEEREQPSIAVSYPMMMEHLRALEDYIRVSEGEEGTILSVKGGNRDVYDIVKDDFSIAFGEDEDVTADLDYLFDDEGKLIKVRQCFGTKNADVEAVCEFKNIGKTYPIMGKDELMP